ncbi:hypothetical protein ACSS31_27100 (plasmid) [Priestia megaterium]
MTNDEINIKRDDFMKILEMSGVPLSAVERIIDIEKSKQKEEEQKKKRKTIHHLFNSIKAKV